MSFNSTVQSGGDITLTGNGVVTLSGNVSTAGNFSIGTEGAAVTDKADASTLYTIAGALTAKDILINIDASEHTAAADTGDHLVVSGNVSAMGDSSTPAADGTITLLGSAAKKFTGYVTADTLRRVTDDEATITYGAMFAPTPVNLLPYDAAMDYVMLEPLVYEGKQVYRDLFGQITRGTFAITSACEEPAALLRWVDVLYTEEGAIEAMVGIQDEDYEFDEDGLWEWVGGVESMSMEKLTALSVYDTGEMPWCFPKAFYDRYADEDVRRINAEMDRLNELAVKPFPTYTLTAEETQYVMGIQQKLGTYVDESLARFVLGEVDITDETVAQFRQGLSDRGMDDVTAFWQEVAQRP